MKNRILVILILGCIPLVAWAGGRNATRYPIVLSHHWSGTAESAFRGDDVVGGDFKTWGVKQALESEGAIVYQPDKTPFASHEARGRLLYRKCAGDTLEEQLCQDPEAETVDGVELAMIDYCADTRKRSAEYTSYEDCIDRVKINIICHSQGCPDSRYMIAAVTNRLSGKPMYKHVASWTSIAGANKGTRLADLALGLVDDSDEPECLGPDFIESMLEANGVKNNGQWVPGGYDSIVGLSRKYMTQTMDISCNPLCEVCPPSFNRAYPNFPSIYYQSYSCRIHWPHACYEATRLTWLLMLVLEGQNDGWMSLDSQRFLTSGSRPGDPKTYVHDRGEIKGETTVFWVNHPGISHMGISNSRVPGLSIVDCSPILNDPEIFYFSREGFYQDVVEDLKDKGF